MSNERRRIRRVLAVTVSFSCILLILAGTGLRTKNTGAEAPLVSVEDGVRTTIRHGWFPNHIGIAEVIDTGVFEYNSSEPGDGTLLRLDEHHFVVESVDGASSVEIAFQLPRDIETGRPYQLRPIPSDRQVEQVDDDTRTASMEPGEFTAFRYANPMAGWMVSDQESKATVTILDLAELEMVIHVRLSADLWPRFTFDIDQEYTLRRMTDGAR